jgi:HlyD family secretion protein
MGSALLLIAWLAGCAPPLAEGQVLHHVARGDLSYQVSLHGELQAEKSEAVYAPQTGDWSRFTVERVLADGTPVKKGDTVVWFERGVAEDELQQSRNQLEVKRAELRREEHELDVQRVQAELDVRRKELQVERAQLGVVEGTTVISKLELAKARVDVRRAQVELALAKQTLASFEEKRRTALQIRTIGVEDAEEDLQEKTQRVDSMEVAAPADGLVYGPYVRLNWTRSKLAPGKVCGPGDKMLEIPDVSTLQAHVFARQRDAALIQEGDPAVLVPAARPEQTLAGRVVTKEEFATTRNERMGTEIPAGNLKEVRIEIALDEAPDMLMPGSTVRATVTTVLATDALLVPVAALHDGPEGSLRVTLASGEHQTVEIGKSTPLFAEVLAGLDEGDGLRIGAAEPPLPR